MTVGFDGGAFGAPVSVVKWFGPLIVTSFGSGCR